MNLKQRFYNFMYYFTLIKVQILDSPNMIQIKICCSSAFHLFDFCVNNNACPGIVISLTLFNFSFKMKLQRWLITFSLLRSLYIPIIKTGTIGRIKK